jgi:hypothetical protein
MTAPVLAQKKFWVVKPKAGRNELWNPTFATPQGISYWTASGAGVTIELTGDYARWGARSMKVKTATGVASSAYYNRGLKVTSGLKYTFSCDVKGVAGQRMRIVIATSTGTARATKTFTATGYWQRMEVTLSATESVTNYRVQITRDAVSSTLPFYVDGVQFEQESKATTFIHGYGDGCKWEGAIRSSASIRSANTGLGGELVDLDTYCKVVQVTGLGHGDWNQILTKMTSGGDMYQTHIRKSRNFSIVVDFIGDTLGEIETNRKAVIDMLRPDLLSNLSVREQFGINMPGSYRGHEQRIIRYQGFAANGDEATQPVDIVCVPLSASLVDTPDLPNHQRAVLNFVVPSGLLQGAYNEGKELDLYANFPAEHIVKRDKDGNWCTWDGTNGTSLITGLNGFVSCMAEGPDGKVYVGGNFTNAGGVTNADYLARWNPVTENWEAVIAGISSYVQCMKFDANGDLYIGGFFTAIGAVTVNKIAKITSLYSGTAQAEALNTGVDGGSALVIDLEIAPGGSLYIVGNFGTVSSVANTTNIARWDGTTWSALSTGLNNHVYAFAFAPNGELYIGGGFTDAGYPYLCKWNGTAFSAVGTNTDIGAAVRALAFDKQGNLYIGGDFINAGGIANADNIAKWTGSRWESLGTGTNNTVYGLFESAGKLYALGAFTTAGGLSLTDRVAVWANGAWQPLDIDLPGAAWVLAILPASDGSLYIGGGFSTAGTAGTPNAKTGIVALNLNVTSASANTYPVISVTGPGTLKMITNYRTGKSVAFDGLTLQPGEWISLNFDPLNLSFRSGWAGRGNLMRYVVPGSDYGDFYLSPGANYLSVFMTDTTAASGATIAWTPLFWGLDGALL